MAYINSDKLKSVSAGVCCSCGLVIRANRSNLCNNCTQNTVDIFKDITNSIDLYFCTNCERYLESPNKWISAERSSPELLLICLKFVKFHSLILEDAQFLWSDPSSRKIKLQVILKKQLREGYYIRQQVVIEFMMQETVCIDCSPPDTLWIARIQIRQKHESKRMFMLMEQIILKSSAADKILASKLPTDGVDLYFFNEADADIIVEIISHHFPCLISRTSTMNSVDTQNERHYYATYTYRIDVAPINKDDVVCIPAKVANDLGQISQLCIVLKLDSRVFLIDPITAQMAELSCQAYWRNQFISVPAKSQLFEYVVQDIDHCGQARSNSLRKPKITGQTSSMHNISEVWVQRKVNGDAIGDMLFARTHLGGSLNKGDVVMGFDVKLAQVHNANFIVWQSNNKHVEIIIAKKVPKSRRRTFKLRHIGMFENTNIENKEYNEFLDDLEEDKNLFKDMVTYPIEKDSASEEEASAVDDDMLNGVAESLPIESEYKLNISKEVRNLWPPSKPLGLNKFGRPKSIWE